MTIFEALAALSEIWTTWCVDQGLPCLSFCEMDCEDLTASQRAYVDAFLVIWNATEESFTD